MTRDEAIARVGIAYAPATYKRAIAFMAGKPRSTEEIAEHLGMEESSAYKVVTALRDLKVICAHAYRPTGIKNGRRVGGQVKLWGLGTENAKPPTPLSMKQRSRNFRARKRAQQFQEAICNGM